jgi:hypothetical protein
LSFIDGDYAEAPRTVYGWPFDDGIQDLAEYGWSGSISSITIDGILRSGRDGTVARLSALESGPVVDREENGLLWYAGQYPDGAGDPDGLSDPGSVSLHDVYTRVGVVKGVMDGGVLTVAVYSSR